MNNLTTDTTAERIRDLEMAMAALDAAEEALRKAARLAELVQAQCPLSEEHACCSHRRSSWDGASTPLTIPQFSPVKRCGAILSF